MKDNHVNNRRSETSS